MREEFEAAYLKDVCVRFSEAGIDSDEWLALASSGEYRSYRAAGAWWGWQASRAALVIGLPEMAPEECTEPEGFDLGVDTTAKILRDLGIKVILL